VLEVFFNFCDREKKNQNVNKRKKNVKNRKKSVLDSKDLLSFKFFFSFFLFLSISENLTNGNRRTIAEAKYFMNFK